MGHSCFRKILQAVLPPSVMTRLCELQQFAHRCERLTLLEHIAIFLGHSPTSSYSCLCRSLSCNHVTITIIISSLRSLIRPIFTPFIHLSAPSIPAGYEPIVTTTITRFSKSKTQHLTSSTVANTLSGLPLKITPHQFSRANKLNHHKSFTEIASTKA